MRHPGRVVSRSILLDQLWEFDKAFGESMIRTYLTNLRCKLKIAGSPQNLIETVYGIGYRLAIPES